MQASTQSAPQMGGIYLMLFAGHFGATGVLSINGDGRNCRKRHVLLGIWIGHGEVLRLWHPARLDRRHLLPLHFASEGDFGHESVQPVLNGPLLALLIQSGFEFCDLLHQGFEFIGIAVGGGLGGFSDRDTLILARCGVEGSQVESLETEAVFQFPLKLLEAVGLRRDIFRKRKLRVKGLLGDRSQAGLPLLIRHLIKASNCCWGPNNYITKMNGQNTVPQPTPSKPKRPPPSWESSLREKYILRERNSTILPAAFQESKQVGASTLSIEQMIACDPLLQELQESLQKEAHTIKTLKLQENFPLRYRDLLQIENNEPRLRQTIGHLEQALRQARQANLQSQKELVQMQESLAKKDCIHQKSLQTAAEQLSQAKESQKQKLAVMRGQLLQRQLEMEALHMRLLQGNCEQETLMDQIVELKEETESLRRENDRLVSQLDGCSLQTARIKADYHVTMGSLQASLEAEEKRQQNLKWVTAEMARERAVWEGRQREKEGEIEEWRRKAQRVKAQWEEESSKKYEQIQEVRVRLLGELKEKHLLETIIEEMKEQEESGSQEAQRAILELRGLITIAEREKEELRAHLTQKATLAEEREISYSQQIHSLQHTHREEIQSFSNTISLLKSHQSNAAQLHHQECSYLKEQLQCARLNIQMNVRVQAEQQRVWDESHKLMQEETHQLSSALSEANEQMGKLSAELMQTKVAMSEQKNVFLQQLEKYKGLLAEREGNIREKREEICRVRRSLKELLASRETLQGALIATQREASLLKQALNQMEGRPQSTTSTMQTTLTLQSLKAHERASQTALEQLVAVRRKYQNALEELAFLKRKNKQNFKDTPPQSSRKIQMQVNKAFELVQDGCQCSLLQERNGQTQKMMTRLRAEVGELVLWLKEKESIELSLIADMSVRDVINPA